MSQIQKYYLEDILEAIKDCNQFVEGFDYEGFLSDVKTLAAVTKKIEDIGEAIKNIDDNLKTLYPEIPWRDLARMRDHLVHRYFKIRYDLVWETVQKDLPPLEMVCIKILESLEEL